MFLSIFIKPQNPIGDFFVFCGNNFLRFEVTEISAGNYLFAISCLTIFFIFLSKSTRHVMNVCEKKKLKFEICRHFARLTKDP